MKAATLLAVVLLLAGTVSSNPAPQVKRPDWVPDWVPSLPEGWFPIDLPDGWFPELPEGWFPELPEGWFPEIEKPDWLPEIEWEQVKEAIQEVINKIRERLESIDWENVTLEQVKEVAKEVFQRLGERIREIVDSIELPPLPELPEIPDININTPVPGQKVSIQEHPSAAQIEFGTGPIWIQACSGAIITNYHILSTARCFTAFRLDSRNRRGRVGATDRYNSGLVYEFSSVVVHESFGNSEAGLFNGDIAIARVVSPIGFTDAIQSVQIVVSDFVIPPNFPVVLAGWGKTAEGTFGFADDDLYSVDLVSIDKAACVEKWASLPLVDITVGPNHFCAGRPETNGRDFDPRDNGVPMYSGGVLVGFASWGHYLGNQRFPIVATSISSYTNWVVANAV